MPAMLQQVAVVRVCGEKGASWKVKENVLKLPEDRRDVGMLLPRKIKKGKQECKAGGSMNRQPGVLGASAVVQ